MRNDFFAELVDLLERNGFDKFATQITISVIPNVPRIGDEPNVQKQDKTEINIITQKKSDCNSCHGTGYLKSRCDEPDRVCPNCNGTGKDEK